MRAWPCPGHTVPLSRGSDWSSSQGKEQAVQQQHPQATRAASALIGYKAAYTILPWVAEPTKAWLLGKFVPRELWCSGHLWLKLSHMEMAADFLPTKLCYQLFYEHLHYCISATFVSMLSCFSFHAVRPLNKIQTTHHFSSIILWHLPWLCLSGVSITFGHQLEKNWCVQHGRAQTCGTALNPSGEKVWLGGRTGPN